MSLAGDYAKFNRMLTPQGGWGLNQGQLAGLQQTAQRNNFFNTMAATQGDLNMLQQRGLGRSVAGAFSYGNRRQRGEVNLLDFFRNLNVDNARLRQQGQMAQMQAAAQLAQANQGPGFGAMFGSILGQTLSGAASGLAGNTAFLTKLGLA